MGEVGVGGENGLLATVLMKIDLCGVLSIPRHPMTVHSNRIRARCPTSAATLRLLDGSQTRPDPLARALARQSGRL